MAVRDLSDLYTPWLEYPDVPWKRHENPDDPESPIIEGTKNYRVASPDAKHGLRLTALANLGVAAATGHQLTDEDRASLQLDDDEERSFYAQVLGDTFDEMTRDGVPWLVIKTISADALLCFGMSREAADMTLEIHRQGEALAAATRPSPTSTEPTPQSTDGSSSSPASTATPARTRSRTSTRSSSATKRAAAKKAAQKTA